MQAARQRETTMLGAAISGLAACGAYDSLDAAVRSMRSETIEVYLETVQTLQRTHSITAVGKS